MAEYWYSSNSKTKVEDLKRKYDALVDACTNLSKTMKSYICVNNKWYDENAVMVAKWWNQSKDGGTSGRLVWTDQGLVIKNANDNKYDGEDRIKSIMNNAACEYLNGVCYSLKCLTSSHPKIVDKFPKEIKACNSFNDGNYVNAGGTNYRKPMENMIGCKAYKDMVLNAASSDGKVSKTDEMNRFITEVAGNLTAIDRCYDNFNSTLKKIAKNTDTNTCWGFDDATRRNLINDLEADFEATNKSLKNFKNNLNTALEHTKQATDLQLDKLKKIIIK